MGSVKHRIGLGTDGSGLTGKNDVSAKNPIVKSPPFRFDSTKIKFDTKVRTFDETGN